MNFFKNLFGDDTTIIGLCGFKTINRTYNKIPIENNFYFNPFEQEKVFETNFRVNKLLL